MKLDSKYKTCLKNGDELIIRSAVKSDAKDILEYLKKISSESDNLPYGEGELDIDIEEEEEYIVDIENDSNCIILLGIVNNEIACLGNIINESRERLMHNAEVSISVKMKYQSLGIGSELLNKLIGFSKDTKIIKNISLGVKEDNYKAIRLYEKFNLKKTGRNKKFFNINGVFFDQIIMALEIHSQK